MLYKIWDLDTKSWWTSESSISTCNSIWDSQTEVHKALKELEAPKNYAIMTFNLDNKGD